MDLFRKHWGILLASLVFLVLLGCILWHTYSMKKAVDEGKRAIGEVKGWIDGVNRSGWKLEGGAYGELENSAIAERNRETAVGHFQEMRQRLYRRYAISPALPRNSSQARGMLDARLASITRLALVKYKMNFQGVIGGKLAEINSDNKPIIEQDFLPIFRQLEIYQEIISLLGTSGVKRVDDLNFPRSLLVEESDGYTVTPISLTIASSPAVLQAFLNSLSQDQRFLFIVRNLSLFDENAESPVAEYSQVALVRRQNLLAKEAAALGEGAKAGMGREGGMTASPAGGRSRGRNAESRGESRGASRRPSTSRTGQLSSPGGMEGLQAIANLDESLLTYEEPKRQDNFVFRTPRTIQAKITLDLIEFAAPEGEGEEAETETEE